MLCAPPRHLAQPGTRLLVRILYWFRPKTEVCPDMDIRRERGEILMHYGFYLPTRGPTASRQGILALAREGERLGLRSAMIADHIVFPAESESIYPYTLDRKHPGGGDALEAFSILGVVAGATERLR